MRILITNNTLADRAGTELYVRDLAVGLVRRGHSPIAYSSVLGEVAAELGRATVPVVNDLSAVGVAPDVIHGQHHLDAMSAMLRFPHVPALYMCHGWQPWQELPPLFPSIVRYVAVDDLCRERLETTPGIDPDRIRTVYNAVDLRRFTPRSPLPSRPRSALIFSNYATEEHVIGAIRAACHAYGISQVDVAGRDSGTSVDCPERALPHYDVVFAKARCALEAMAVGCAVIVADRPGLGGLVTPESVERQRRLNFGVRTMQAAPLTEDTVTRELHRYNAARSHDVSAFIRAHAGSEQALDTLEAIYEEVRAEPVTWSETAGLDACAAASAYITALASIMKAWTLAHEASVAADAWSETRIASLSNQVQRLSSEMERLTDEAQRLTEEDQRHRAEAHRHADWNRELNTELGTTRLHLSAATREVTAVTTELSAVRRSRTWRALGLYRRVRAWAG